MGWENFSIWRGKLPHWRADNVSYYLTFKHRRPLGDEERRLLLSALLKPNARRWDLLIICVLPERTELILEVLDAPTGEKYELSDVVEKAKQRAGREIVKKSGERFPPFFNESYDRILRDDEELQTFWEQIFDSPVKEELVEDSEEYDTIWVANAYP